MVWICIHVNTYTELAIENVCINGVSILRGLDLEKMQWLSSPGLSKLSECAEKKVTSESQLKN